MSKSLSSVASVEFDTEVKQAYQGQSNLASTVTQRNNVTGDTYNFRRMGKGLANQKASQADVTPMDVDNTKQPATLENWNAPEYTDIFDQAAVNFDEQEELAEAIGMAIARREDQMVIDAAIAVAGTQVALGAANLTTAKLRTASKNLNKKGVPGKNRHICVSAEGLDSLLGEEETTSSDFNTVKALVNGEIDTFVGFKFHIIEDRDEGGLPITGGLVRTSVAYHMKAVGIAKALGPRTEVNYIAQKTSWLANGILKAGSVGRDGEGVVDIQCQET